MGNANTNAATVNFVMRVSGGSLPKDYGATINVVMDFAGVSETELRNVASRSLRIDLQRVLRTKSPEYLDGLAKTGLKLHASEAGKDIRTRDDKIAELVAAGMPPKLAALSIDDPTKFAKLMESIG